MDSSHLGAISTYDGGPPRRDQNGNIIPEPPGSGCGCLVYPVLLLLIIGVAWYAIRNWL